MNLASRPFLLTSLILWLTLTGFGIYFLLNIKNYINFGIDLVGGTYITLEVETDKAIENELFDKSQNFIKRLQQDKKDANITSKIENNEAVLKFASDAEASAALATLSADQDSKLALKQEGSNIKFSFVKSVADSIRHDAVEGNIAILRTRLDSFGVGEITIAAQGEKNIIIELPNVDDPEKAKARIGKTALLELKPVFDHGQTKEEIIERHGGQLPEGTIIVPGKAGADRGAKFYLLPTYSEVTGRLLKTAFYSMMRDDLSLLSGQKSPHIVNISFKSEGAEKFADLTRKNVGNQIAIVIDNVVISAPAVDKEIEGGEAYISGGNTTKQEAQELATMLKSGAFVAPVKYVEERHIGPSLGNESVRSGLISCVIALVLLFLFSIITYKVAGIFAFIVLVYNLLVILLGLSTIGATLTLPGIAGMVLTIGMAIDASILIFERVREEIARGVSARKAIDEGFAGATAVILDANITHFLVSIVLYWLGTGPIQGFASTMIIGILSTLLTGLLLLKTLFNAYFDFAGFKKISI